MHDVAGHGSGPVPAAGLLAAWGTAFLRGRAAADDVVAALEGRHRVVGPAAGDGPVGVVVALAGLRAAGVTALRPVLPVPGDALGLPGPASFVRDATAAGQAVVTVGPPWQGWVPTVSADGSATAWTATEVAASTGPAGLPTLAEADRELAEALREATEALSSLDVAAGRDEVAAALAAARRRVPRVALPDVLGPRAVALLDRATGLAAVVAVAERHPGAAVTAGESAARAEALRALGHAVRRALVAAYAAAAEPGRPGG